VPDQTSRSERTAWTASTAASGQPAAADPAVVAAARTSAVRDSDPSS
jgi:hypothetical protein